MGIQNDIWSLFKKIESKDSSAGGPPEYIIAGLGNPGQEYEYTRHNTGFLAMDKISADCGVKVDKLKFKSLTSLATFGGHRVFLMKPCTYMNSSGEAVVAAMEFYKIPIQNVVIVSDDISLPVGKMRIRRKGSDGGHNGLKSIIYLSGSNEFPRVKVGIGTKPDGWDLADWVLSKYTDDELKTLDLIFSNTVSAIKLMMDGKTEEAMGKYN